MSDFLKKCLRKVRILTSVLFNYDKKGRKESDRVQILQRDLVHVISHARYKTEDTSCFEIVSLKRSQHSEENIILKEARIYDRQ